MGARAPGQAQYALYHLADGSAPGWINDDAVGNASSYQLTLSRSGHKWAVMTDDGPDNGGTIQHISITLETAAGTPPNTSVVDTHCTIPLPASKFSTNHGSSLASMSFSSDGSILAWGQDDGVYEANVSNPNDCATVTGSVHLVVPGGQMPFLGAAALSPPAPPTGTGTTGGGGSKSGGGSSTGHAVAGAPNTAITSLRLNKRSRQAALKFRGSRGVGKLSFKCKLDHGRWASCHSPKTYKHLKGPAHVRGQGGGSSRQGRSHPPRYGLQGLMIVPRMGYDIRKAEPADSEVDKRKATAGASGEELPDREFDGVVRLRGRGRRR